mgnify:CR=1 FL=1
MNNDTNKPTMSNTEASFHEVVAGNRAKAEAEASGGNQAAIEAVANATLEHRVVAGYELKPASQGTIFVLQEVARRFEEYCKTNPMHSSGDPKFPGSKELLEIGLSVLVFADPRRIFKDVQDGKIEELRYEAEEIIWTLPAEKAKLLNDHFTTEMDRLNQLSGSSSADAPGKPQLDQQENLNGTSEAQSHPSQVTGSPSSSGSCPPTTSASPTPSGISPSQ